MSRPVAPGLFTLDPPRLLGARCADCGYHSFPHFAGCPYCGSESVEPVELSDHGILWGWTTVLTAPPGYLGDVPYGFGVVELPEGIRVISRLALPDSTWTYGQPMHLRIVTLDDGHATGATAVSTWEFAP